MNRSRHVVVIAAVSALVAAIACGSEDETPTPAPGSSPTVSSTTAANVTPGSSDTPVTTRIPGATRTPVTSPTPPAATATTGPVLGRELLTGGSFESGNFDEWEPRVGTGQQIEISDDVALTGERSLHMTSPTEGDWPMLVLRQRFFVEGGKSYQWGFSALQNEYGPVQMLFTFNDDREAALPGTLTSDWTTTSGNNWLDVRAITIAPEGAVTASVAIQLRIRPEAAENVSGDLEVFVDDVTVREVLG